MLSYKKKIAIFLITINNDCHFTKFIFSLLDFNFVTRQYILLSITNYQLNKNMEIIRKQPKEIDEYNSPDWDEPRASRCNPCHVSVNDAGSFQCDYCNAFFDDPKRIKMILKDLYGEFAEVEYKKLKKIRGLVLKGCFDKLRENQISYVDENGDTINQRKFYELPSE